MTNVFNSHPNPALRVTGTRDDEISGKSPRMTADKVMTSAADPRLLHRRAAWLPLHGMMPICLTCQSA
jgi:hypothetical protein